MRVALICIDRPDALQTRLDNRAAHLAHIAATGVVEMAGPLLNTEGQMTGSLIILTVDAVADEVVIVAVPAQVPVIEKLSVTPALIRVLYPACSG